MHTHIDTHVNIILEAMIPWRIFAQVETVVFETELYERKCYERKCLVSDTHFLRLHQKKRVYTTRFLEDITLHMCLAGAHSSSCASKLRDKLRCYVCRIDAGSSRVAFLQPQLSLQQNMYLSFYHFRSLFLHVFVCVFCDCFIWLWVSPMTIWWVFSNMTLFKEQSVQRLLGSLL